MGNLIDAVFGGGKAQAYGDLQKGIQGGMGTRTDWERRAEEALSPYMGPPRLMDQYEKAIASGADPAALYKQLSSTYQESPAAKVQQQAGMDAIRAAQAASGMHGSGAEMQALQKNAQDISTADQQDYINKLLGIRSNYLGQLGGIAGRESEQQYGARGNVAGFRQQTGGALDEDAQRAAQAQAMQDMSRSGGFNNLLNMGLGLFGMSPWGQQFGNYLQGQGWRF